MARITKLLLFVVLPLSFIVAFGQIKSAYAATGINRAINFQGKIVNKTDSTNITNGNYSFTFKLYDAASGGTQLPSGSAWSETQTLTVTDGLFQATIGGTTTFPQTLDFNSDSIYLDITFDGETFGSRVRLTAVPYAFNAEKVNGLTVTATTGTLTIPNSTTITFAGANNLTLSTTGITGLTLPTSGTVTVGIGDANYLARWLSANQLSTGVSYDNGSSLGIGTTANGSKLTVSGGIAIGSTVQNSSYLSAAAPPGGLIVEGNVGIGSTGRSGYALDVGGNVNIGSTITVNGFKFGTSTTSGHVLTVDSSGVGTWQAASGGVTGGAVNNVARWLSATQLSTGVSYDDGSLFGIGTTAPASTRAYIMGTGTSTAFAFRIADSAGTDRLSVRDNGNIGIGTTSGSFRLQVKETRTDTGSGSQSMIYNELTVNPGDNSSTNFITSWNRLFTPTGSTATFNIINGLTNETIHQAASTVTTARGLTGKVKIDSSDGNSIITDANSI